MIGSFQYFLPKVQLIRIRTTRGNRVVNYFPPGQFHQFKPPPPQNIHLFSLVKIDTKRWYSFLIQWLCNNHYSCKNANHWGWIIRLQHLEWLNAPLLMEWQDQITIHSVSEEGKARAANHTEMQQSPWFHRSLALIWSSFTRSWHTFLSEVGWLELHGVKTTIIAAL